VERKSKYVHLTTGEELKQLARTFAAEVSAPPFRDWLSHEGLQQLLQTHLVLVFRNQHGLTLSDQLSLTALFGAVDKTWDIHHRHPEDERIQIISNENRKGITFKSSTLYWHSLISHSRNALRP
jgi:alpha-ketoglutarate-dependent taurine dioxygenase